MADLAAARGGLLARHWQKLVAALIWLGLAGAFVGYGAATGRGPGETLAALVGLLRSPLGPLLYIAVYTVRPLAFFSAVAVSLLGGAIWGPLWGTLLVVVGSNLSASLAYAFGRALGHGVLPEGQAADGLAARYAARLRANTFSTVLIMRLIYLPYDLVNYLGGFLRAPFRPFLLATALGSLPGTLVFVLAGSALPVDDILAGRAAVSAVNPWALALSLALLVGGLGLARLLRRAEEGRAR